MFHLCVLAIAVATRKNNTVQGCMLLALCALVYAAQYINGYLRTEWRALGWTQAYFTENGAFITVVYSAPLLCVCAFLMVRRVACIGLTHIGLSGAATTPFKGSSLISLAQAIWTTL